MTAAFESLLPIFILIALGFLLRWREIVPDDMWRGIEILSYWVFFPALLLETLVRADLRALPLTGILFTMAAVFLTMAGALLLARRTIMRTLDINGAAFSSVFQSVVRWNSFLALPVLAKLYGDAGVAMVAVVMGLLVPMANFASVYVVAQNAAASRLSVPETLRIVFRNPFIWATAMGLIINIAGIPIYEPLMTTLTLLGGAAIAAGLLMVGAGLRIEEARRPSRAVWFGTVARIIGMPALVIIWGTLFGLTGPAFVACMVSAAVPTATSAYVLARQLGGDAPLVATTLTVQTAISFITIPLFIWLAQTMW